METNRQKWVTGTYLAFAVFAGYVVNGISISMAGAWDLEARIPHVDLIIRGAAVLVGIIVFMIFSYNEKTNQYTHEVVEELSRVTWPTTDDTWRATYVVLIMVLVCGAMLGVMDTLWAYLIQKSFLLKSLI